MSERGRLHAGGHRRDALWLAAMVHRVSGLALACFLPLHFLALSLALGGEARLDGFLRWTESPYVKLAETGLVFLLAVHMLGGIRVLAVENLAWREGQKRRALLAGGAAIVVAALFILTALI
jgi:fumarate reductase subunit D